MIMKRSRRLKHTFGAPWGQLLLYCISLDVCNHVAGADACYDLTRRSLHARMFKLPGLQYRGPLRVTQHT